MSFFQQDIAEKLFHLLNSFHVSSKDIEKGMELTQERLEILFVLVNQGPQTINQLAEIEQVSAPAITRTVKALEKLGYAIKSRSKTDQRVVYVAPTRKSQQTIEAIRTQQKRLVGDLLQNFSKDEYKLLDDGVSLLLSNSNKSKAKRG
ncbi:MarR family winged helix-turn-helix transcriptional regulator [Kangiella sediminilitoris]|uniref:Transcriptional regulator, MarR family n=1 Tax=Kangiella sediminilitoris TaxID=1144748 RepID=A0A1B3BBD8_9GAMM|nr:MarR family transcriptional regulator [Kangiella sediminilitoris]AOE50105.1 Transcriptional regulator, MarR family [Kangiella sediminilitoris]